MHIFVGIDRTMGKKYSYDVIQQTMEIQDILEILIEVS